MYVFSLRNQSYILDRDEKRVGKYMETAERVPAVVRVHRYVRQTKITKTGSNPDINGYFLRNNAHGENVFFEEWLGKNVDLKI